MLRSRYVIKANKRSIFGALRQFGVVSTNDYLHVSEEVREAVHTRKPVVALETTIYTHGFPYPENVALASELEDVVRKHGGVPATIGVLNGVARVGFSPQELEELTSSVTSRDVLKISRRDLAYACSSRLADKSFNGGTTVAGTMILAHLAGIRIFATGGLGGVHRGAETSMDVSADLTELGRTPVSVVSSGCKSFLDIGRTLEYLETEGVPVATFADGRSGDVEFPGFWTRDSGLKSPMTIRDEVQAAAMIQAQHALSLTSGMLFANPAPIDAAIDSSKIDRIINEAIAHAADSGATGKDNTPFILARIKELTNGDSVKANRALVRSNVRRGTLMAVELAKLEDGPSASNTFTIPVQPSSRIGTQSSKLGIGSETLDSATDHSSIASAESAKVIVCGSIAVDSTCDYNPLSSNSLTPELHTSNPAMITESLGGVGYNIARTIASLGVRSRLFTAVGKDLRGQTALQNLASHGFPARDVSVVPDGNTAQYIAVNDVGKDLVLAMADFGIFEQDHPGLVEDVARAAEGSEMLVLDANWSPGHLMGILEAVNSTAEASRPGTRPYTVLEPVSVPKAKRFFDAFVRPPTSSTSFPAVSSRGVSPPPHSQPIFPNHLLDLITPNALELTALHDTARASGALDSDGWWRIINALGIPSSGARDAFVKLMPSALVNRGIPQRAVQLLPFVPAVVVTLGDEGVLVVRLVAVGDRERDGERAGNMLSYAGEQGEQMGIRGVYVRYFPPEEKVDVGEVVSVNGVGDTFLAALVAGLSGRFSRKGSAVGSVGRDGTTAGMVTRSVEDEVPFAQRAAVLTLKSRESVSPELETIRHLL